MLLDGDCKIRVLEHVRASDPDSDHLRFVVGQGTETYASINVSRVRVIPELRLAVPVLADHTGLRIVARCGAAAIDQSGDPRSVHDSIVGEQLSSEIAMANASAGRHSQATQ